LIDVITPGIEMNFDVLSFLFDNLFASGVIGGYVAISIIVVNVLTYLYKDNFTQRVKSAPKGYHPIIGALLGVIPGCGGTIVASILHKNKNLSFGGLLAAFIATLGEGSFVLLGASTEPLVPIEANLKAFVIVNIVGASVGMIAGGISDALKFNGINYDMNLHEGDPSSEIGIESRLRFKKTTEKIGLFLILGITLFLTPGSFMALWGGSIASIEDLTVYMCIAMTLVSIFYYSIQHFLFDGHCHSASQTNIRSVFLESIMDITMVITYVFIGLVAVNFVIDIVVGKDQFSSWMTESQLVVVFIAALIGATPGCGGMIAVAVAYATLQDFPIAALLAAGIATSGDGIFPLLAKNKKHAFTITGLSLVIALIVGYATVFLV